MAHAPESVQSRLRRVRPLLPFFVWVGWFLVFWTVVVVAGGLWGEVLEHWPISVAMIFGSYVAGSTPMGGGTIGFPILVLLLGEAPALGRSFSYCIQSVGMVSASMYIICTGRAVAARLLLWTMLASTVTLPVAYACLTPLVPDAAVKLTFAVIWGGFGILTLVRLKSLLRAHGMPALDRRLEMALGLCVGVVGGVAAALTGVGIDMVMYTVLVLVYRVDLRIAVPSSVIIMAYNSLLGAVNAAAWGHLGPEVIYNWLAAAPFVLFGAPIGVFALLVLKRGMTLVIVSVLCLAQLVWACVDVGVGWATGGAVVLAVLGMNGAFHLLHAWGRGLVPDGPVAAAPPGG